MTDSSESDNEDLTSKAKKKPAVIEDDEDDDHEGKIFKAFLRGKEAWRASNPLFIIPDIFLHFSNKLCYGYLRFEGIFPFPSNLR